MKKLTIKDLPKHGRPREKLKEKGVGALTDQELVAAILGSGTKGVDVRTMAMKVANLIKENKGLLIRSQKLYPLSYRCERKYYSTSRWPGQAPESLCPFDVPGTGANCKTRSFTYRN